MTENFCGRVFVKILLLTHNFTPDLGAASFRMDSLVRFLSRKHKVTVITAYPNRYKNLNIKIEDDYNDNVQIIRIKNFHQSNKLFKRSFSYLDYFLKSFFVVLRHIDKNDIIVATSPQILTGYLGAIFSKKNKPLVLDIRDLWPDAMIDLNLVSKKSLIYKILKMIEKFMYKKSKVIVINSPSFEEHIRKYVKNKKIYFIPNGVDDYIVEYFEKRPINLFNKEEKIKVLYAGNLGLAQDILILTKISKEVGKYFHFILIGDGSQREKIEREIKIKSIENIEIRKPLKREELFKEYEKCDAFFVHLKNIPMFKRTIPSKIFEYVATKKPVLYGLNGVAKEIMDELNAGFSFKSGDIEDLERALLDLKNAIDNGLWEYKTNEILIKKYLRSNLSEKFVKVIEDVCYENKR